MIPLFRPIRPDMKYVMDIYESVLESGQLTNFGTVHDYCSKILADRYDGYWLPVTNGSVALEVALMMLPKEVKRIAVPNFTFVATIQAIIRAGKKPVIFAVKNDLEMDIELLRKHERSYDAILAVVPFGNNYYSETKLTYFCMMHGKKLIWDRAGSFPSADYYNINTYSLHASKSLPVCEGGLIRFPTREMRERAKKFICFGFNEKKESDIGNAFNFKLDELRSTVLYYFLNNMGEVQIRQQRMSHTREEYISHLSDHLYSVDHSIQSNISLIVLNMRRAKKLCVYLNNNGINAKLYYSPLLQDHPAFKKYRFIGKNKQILNKWIALPSDVTSDERAFVIKKIKEFYRKN